MKITTTAQPRLQACLSPPATDDLCSNPQRTLLGTNNLSTLIARIAAVALVLASAGFGALYAWGMGSDHGPAFAILAVVMALGLEIAKPLAVTGALDAFRAWSPIRGLALALVGAVAVTYSLTAELSLMAGARGDKVAERVASNAMATTADAERARLTIELAAIGQTRPSAAINSELAAILTDKRLQDCEGWLESTRLRTKCVEVVSPLKSELATAEKKEKLEAELATLRATPHGTQVTADPASHAIATYLAALCIRVDPAVLSEWIVLVPVLALEVGSAFAGLLVGGSPPNTLIRVRSTPTPEKPAKPEQILEPESVQSTVQTTPIRLAVSNVPAERLLELLMEKGGSLLTGQRVLAQALGMSTGGVNALLHSLADQGSVTLRIDKFGTQVALKNQVEKVVL
jgi:hypothetical protein